MVHIEDFGNLWKVAINDDLIFSGKIDYINKEKRVIRYWGRGKDGREYTKHVFYPKKFFPSREYMEEVIIPKYEECPYCKIENSNFKYSGKDKYKHHIKPFKGKKNMLGKVKNWLKSNPEFTGQGIAQLPKTFISLLSTDLGAKLINTGVGAVGTLINEKTKKSPILRSAFWNMFWSWADPTANQLRSIKRSWDDLVLGVKMGAFDTAFGALLEDPQEIVGALKNAMPKFSKVFSKFNNPFKGKFGSAGFVPPVGISEKILPEITPRSVTTYATNDDIMDY